MIPSHNYSLPRISFLALDFETANEEARSACALAVAQVDRGLIRSVRRWFVRPPDDVEFRFSDVHGIHREDVAEASDGQSAVTWLASSLTHASFIAAHNARFDARVLSSLTRRLAKVLPQRAFVCSAKLYRLAFGRSRTDLQTCAAELGIPLRHHDPRSDAVACARIVLAAARTKLGRRAIAGLVATARWWS